MWPEPRKRVDVGWRGIALVRLPTIAVGAVEPDHELVAGHFGKDRCCGNDGAVEIAFDDGTDFRGVEAGKQVIACQPVGNAVEKDQVGHDR